MRWVLWFIFYWKPVKEATIQYLLFFEGMNSLLISGYKIMACGLWRCIGMRRWMAIIVSNMASPSLQIRVSKLAWDVRQIFLYLSSWLMFENHTHLSWSKSSVSNRTFYVFKKTEKLKYGSSRFMGSLSMSEMWLLSSYRVYSSFLH